MASKPCIFIHTNQKQILGAIVSRYSFSRFAPDPNAFDVRLVETKDYPVFNGYEGKQYLRDKLKRTWINDDLQSFTLLRFTPPEIMGYQGRSMVVDPDVFAVADVTPLITRDMQGKAILARHQKGSKSHVFASSVMLLDNSKLSHWNLARGLEEMFAFKRDYADWITLQLEDQSSIGVLETVWNDFDRLTPETRMLHTTQRRTQPWKTGLPIDFRPREAKGSLDPRMLWHRLRRTLFGEHGLMGRYKRHPDPRQEQLFFGLLKECVEKRIVSEEMVKDEMRANHVRHDAFAVMDKVPPLAAIGFA